MTLLLASPADTAAREFEGRPPRTPAECERVWKLALGAAAIAAGVENARLGPENRRGLDCGFAWIVVAPATQPFAKWTKAQEISSKHYGGGQNIWYSKLHDLGTQSISVHQAAAQAAAEVMQRANVKCYTGSRLD